MRSRISEPLARMLASSLTNFKSIRKRFFPMTPGMSLACAASGARRFDRRSIASEAVGAQYRTRGGGEFKPAYSAGRRESVWNARYLRAKGPAHTGLAQRARDRGRDTHWRAESPTHRAGPRVIANSRNGVRRPQRKAHPHCLNYGSGLWPLWVDFDRRSWAVGPGWYGAGLRP